MRRHVMEVQSGGFFSEERARTCLNFNKIISIAVKHILEVCLYTKLRVLFHLINFVLAENRFLRLEMHSSRATYLVSGLTQI